LTVHLVDSNVFYYHLLQDKQHGSRAASIIRRIRDGEEASTSVIVLSELTSLFEFRIAQARRSQELPQAKRTYVIQCFEKSISLLHDLLISLAHLKKLGCGWDETAKAFTFRPMYEMDFNDALNLAIMERHGISNIYSFDRCFDRVPWVTRDDR